MTGQTQCASREHAGPSPDAADVLDGLEAAIADGGKDKATQTTAYFAIVPEAPQAGEAVAEATMDEPFNICETFRLRH